MGPCEVSCCQGKQDWGKWEEAPLRVKWVVGAQHVTPQAVHNPDSEIQVQATRGAAAIRLVSSKKCWRSLTRHANDQTDPALGCSPDLGLFYHQNSILSLSP